MNRIEQLIKLAAKLKYAAPKMKGIKEVAAKYLTSMGKRK
jgi:hypothetical protein